MHPSCFPPKSSRRLGKKTSTKALFAQLPLRFVSGCMQLHGPAKSMQMAKMSYENKSFGIEWVLAHSRCEKTLATPCLLQPLKDNVGIFWVMSCLTKMAYDNLKLFVVLQANLRRFVACSRSPLDSSHGVFAFLLICHVSKVRQPRGSILSEWS